MLKLNYHKSNSSFLGVLLILAFIGLMSSNLLANSPNKLIGISNVNSMEMSEPEDAPWLLGYSDNQIQIFYQSVVCDGKEMVKMRIINLTLKSIKINYSLWEEKGFKSMEIEPLANLEGICSSDYKYPLMELVPSQIKDKKVSVIVKYINQ
jgi:hypothetical protein